MFGLRKVVKLFKDGNVCVAGLKGTGKDLLFSNVIARRKKEYYVSNMDYSYKHVDLIFSKFRTGNSYNDLLDNKVKQYLYPYPDGTDIYISDAGIYFPSQYNGELNKLYKDFPQFMALSRHLGNCNVHFNSQNYGRVWDKIREQSDTYILMLKSYVLFGKIVISSFRIYEKAESFQNRVPPCRIKVPLFNKDRIQSAKIAVENYRCTHGIIKSLFVIYWNKGKYDSRRFKTIFERGEYAED